MNVDVLAKRLEDQMVSIEKKFSSTLNNIKDVEHYVVDKLVDVRHIVESLPKATEWARNLSEAIQILGEIERIIGKIEDIQSEEYHYNHLERLVEVIKKRDKES